MNTALLVGAEVERYSSPLHAALRSLPEQPAVLAGGARHLGAAAGWSLEQLAARCGDVQVPVETAPAPPADLLPARWAESMPLRDYIHVLRTPGTHRLRMLPLPLPAALPALMDDIDLPPWFLSRPAARVELQLWPAGSRAGLHYEEQHLLLAQLRGCQQLLLFAPADTACLYRHAAATGPAHYSRVDATRPDFARYPRFEDARPLRCTLQEGDALCLPAYWWCQSSTTDTLLAVRCSWQPAWRDCLQHRQFRWRLLRRWLGLGRSGYAFP